MEESLAVGVALSVDVLREAALVLPSSLLGVPRGSSRLWPLVSDSLAKDRGNNSVLTDSVIH